MQKPGDLQVLLVALRDNRDNIFTKSLLLLQGQKCCNTELSLALLTSISLVQAVAELIAGSLVLGYFVWVCFS